MYESPLVLTCFYHKFVPQLKGVPSMILVRAPLKGRISFRHLMDSMAPNAELSVFERGDQGALGAAG